MAITSSAKKAHRASLRKRVFNVNRQDAVRSVLRQIKKLVSDKKIAEANVLISKAYKAIDKAAKGHTIKKGAASRKKSRLARFIGKAK